MPSYANNTKVYLKGLPIVATHLFAVFWKFSIFDSRGNSVYDSSGVCTLPIDLG